MHGHCGQCGPALKACHQASRTWNHFVLWAAFTCSRAVCVTGTAWISRCVGCHLSARCRARAWLQGTLEHQAAGHRVMML